MLHWSRKNYGPMSWNEAVEFVKNLKEDKYQDWRLPTIQELIGIIDFERCSPASMLPDIRSLDSYGYWSSSTHAYCTDYAWSVHFCNGYVNYNFKADHYYVRAVRQ